MKICDAHSHLQDPQFNDCRDETVARAASAGVFHIVCCGTHEKDWDRVTEISARHHPHIFPSYGLHPWFADSCADDDILRLKLLLANNPRAGVGEIGLDWTEGKPDRTLQENIFRRQLLVAIEMRRPLSLHCVQAWGPFVAILREFGAFPAGGLVHAFSGSAEILRELDELGLFMSFGCGIVNKYNTRAREALKHCPLDRLLFESDAPALPALGNARSEPADVAEVLKTASEITRRTVEDLAGISTGNWERLFSANCLNLD